ncbi:MAG TPA: YfhO family protein [Verrucomicrobiae bacterium]
MTDQAAANSGNAQRDWAAPGRFALLLAAMIAIPFWDILSGLKTFVIRDYGLYSYPVAYYLRQSFWRGEWPLWNPYSCCGLPFLAQFNTLALYPFSLIYCLLPLTWGLGVFCLLHIFMAGMGMYFLAARWTDSRAGAAVAGVVFAFNGLTLNFLMWPSHLATLAWTPWVILLAEDGWKLGGRKLFLAALAAGMQILAGGPEEILFTWLILAVLAAARIGKTSPSFITVVRRFLTMSLLGGGVAAAQALPFADFVLHSNRDTHFANSAWSMPPWGWGNFLVPLFQTSKWQQIVVQRAQYWTSSYYVGIGTLFLVVMALWRFRTRRVWMLGLFFLTSIILALGDGGFVFLWVKKLLPFLGMFRYPVKFVILTVIAVPLLAAFGMAYYDKRTPEDAKGWTAPTITISAMLALIGALLLIAWKWPLENTSLSATSTNALTRAIFLVLTFAIVWMFVKRPESRAWTVVLLLGLCWGDLMTHMPWQNPTLDPDIYQPGLGQMSDKLDPVPKIGESRLMMSPFSARQLYYKPVEDVKANYALQRVMFLADCNLLDGLPKVDGFFSLALRNTDKVLWLLDSVNGRQLDKVEDLLSVSQTIAEGKVFDWTPRTNYIPIVTIGQQPLFASDDDAFKAIAAGEADFRHNVYLTPEAKSTVKATLQPSARVISKDFGANRQKLEVDTPSDTMLVLTEAYYHNWQAFLDGHPTPVLRANYAFKAVEIPPGRHEVILVYKDEAFETGGAISICSLLLCLVGLLLSPIRNTTN